MVRNKRAKASAAAKPQAMSPQSSIPTRKHGVQRDCLVEIAYFGTPHAKQSLYTIVHATCKKLGVEDKGSAVARPKGYCGKAPPSMFDVKVWADDVVKRPNDYPRAPGFLGNLHQTLRSVLPLDVIERIDNE